jgi:hypothetical protein
MRISRIATLSAAPLEDSTKPNRGEERMSYDFLYLPVKQQPIEQSSKTEILHGPDDGQLRLFGRA